MDGNGLRVRVCSEHFHGTPWPTFSWHMAKYEKFNQFSFALQMTRHFNKSSVLKIYDVRVLSFRYDHACKLTQNAPITDQINQLIPHKGTVKI